MKLFKLSTLAMTLIIGGAALAQEKEATPQKGDVVINVQAPVLQPATQALPIQQVGQTAYQTQESTLGATQKKAGVEYYYVWVGVNGQYVPVDPMRVTE